ncbi:MAG: UMP kinase [Phycisphaerae bacterium]|nr:UMP kinase [Phycisphaerae bacterium]
MAKKKRTPVRRAKAECKFHRVILKISGEGFARPGGFGVDGAAVRRIAEEIVLVTKLGVQVGVVVGGGNFLRGATVASRVHIRETTAHYMGMLATVMNALALQDMLEDLGQPTRVQSSIAIQRACESFIHRRCIRHMEKGRVVILAGGTGRPFVTTDTAAALVAAEISADVVFKATNVDGVYSADPKKDKKAKFLPSLTYNQVINRRLKVMDVSAVDMCQRNGVPIAVFSLAKAGNMRSAVLGKKVGTRIHD